MNKSNFWPLIGCMFLVFTSVLLPANAAQVKSSAPPANTAYGQVDDFVNGGTHLLRNDDLVISIGADGAGTTTGRNFLLAGGVINYTDPNTDELVQVLTTNGSKDLPLPKVIPNGAAGCVEAAGCEFQYQAQAVAAPVTGRFFRTDRDSTVVFPFQFDSGQPTTLVSLSGTTLPAPAQAGKVAQVGLPSFQWQSYVGGSWGGATVFFAKVADFNGDGFDDILMAYTNPSVFPSNPRFNIATAVDVNNPVAGFKYGPEFTLPNPYAQRAVEVGDFDGNRLPDIASVDVDVNGQMFLATYTVNPGTLAISSGAAVPVKADARADRKGDDSVKAPVTDFPIQLTAGRFTPNPNQQLILSYLLKQNSSDTVRAQIFDFAAGGLKPQLQAVWNSGDFGADFQLLVKAGRFDWSSPSDAVAWFVGSRCCEKVLTMLKVEPNPGPRARGDNPDLLTVTRTPASLRITDPNATPVIMDMALGNFNHRRPSAANPQQTERNPDLQIALVAYLHTDKNDDSLGKLYIIEVDRALTKLTNTQAIDLNFNFYNQMRSIHRMSVAAADLRGLSYRLGAGRKVTLKGLRKYETITAMPPMHVDYFQFESDAKPMLLNLTAAPADFNMAYNVSTQNSKDTQITNAISHSFGFEETVGASVEFGDVEESGVKVEDTFSAAQDIQTSSSKLHGAVTSQGMSTTSTTGWGDLASYTTRDFHVWVYDVVGRQVCPKEKGANCAAADQRPLTVQFSATSTSSIQGLSSGDEFYQPVWEPGNILSYPGSIEQLQRAEGGTLDVISEETSWKTDDSGTSQSLTWTQTLTDGNTVGSQKTFSEKNTTSVQAQGSIIGIKVGGSTSFDSHFAQAFDDLTVTTAVSNKSQGMTLSKTGSFASPQTDYAYPFTPIIYGDRQPGPLVDKLDLGTDIKIFGTLSSAFLVDPTDATKAGRFWSAAYQPPDVALNHPSRWLVGPPKVSPAGSLDHCLLGKGGLTCATLAPFRSSLFPSNVLMSDFHDMRGFFVSNADAPAGGATTQNVAPGTRVRLQARVYNYSLDPDSLRGTSVKVAFYAIPWQVISSSNKPGNKPAGDMFHIGTATLSPEGTQTAPIRGFDKSSEDPNWRMAEVIWQTPAADPKTPDRYYLFVVAAWAVDASGNLVAENPGHGLTDIPDRQQFKSFWDLANLEPKVDDPTAASGSGPVSQVSFSNNVGVYGAMFHVGTLTTSNVNPAALSAKARKAPIPPKLQNVRVVPGRSSIALGESVEIGARVRAHKEVVQGLDIYFSDGNPRKNGKAFDVERIPKLKVRGRYDLMVNFYPQSCGIHKIFVHGAPGEVGSGDRTPRIVRVRCTRQQRQATAGR